jgi:hypothetical protein
MIEKNCDVQAFNTHVRQLMHTYRANKQAEIDSETLMANLFDSYLSCKDREFVDYIKQYKRAHYDSTIILTPETLMDYALKQYQTQVQELTWGEEAPDKKDMMSLVARVVNVEAKLEATTTRSSLINTQRYLPPQMSKEQWRRRRYENAPSWMKRAPADENDRRRKKVGAYNYTWCKFHQLWQRHTADQCHINPAKRGNAYRNNNVTDNRARSKRHPENHRESQASSRHGLGDDRKPRRRMAMQAADDDDDTEGEREFYAEEEDKGSDYPEFEYEDDEEDDDE